MEGPTTVCYTTYYLSKSEQYLNNEYTFALHWKYLNRMESITCILLIILTFGLNGLKQALFAAQYQAVESSASQFRELSSL